MKRIRHGFTEEAAFETESEDKQNLFEWTEIYSDRANKSRGREEGHQGVFVNPQEST